VATYYTDMAPA